MKLSVILKKSNRKINSYDLSPTKVTAIGWHKNADIPIKIDSDQKLLNKGIEYCSAIIPSDDGEYILQDLGSKIQIIFNEKQISYQTIRPGQIYSIGEYTLEIIEIPDNQQEESVPIEKISDTLKDSLITEINGKKTFPAVQTYEILYELLRIIADEKDLKKICSKLVKTLVEKMHLDRAFFAFVENDEIGKCITCYPEEVPLKISFTLFEKVIESKNPVFIEDPLSFKNEKGIVPESIITMHTKLAFCMPLLYIGEVKGILYLDTRSDECAQSIKNQKLFDLLKDNVSKFIGKEIENIRLRVENDTLKNRQLKSTIIVGNSPKVKHALDDIATFAPEDVPVFIHGESGCGKELIARALHEQSARRDGPFIAMNCACVVETLMESELFGVIEKYPGMHNDRPLIGKLEQADGGTLFLDEVGDLSLSVQAKILRFMEDFIVTPLGGTPKVVSVRIISATNKNIPEMIKEKQFRHDLFQRMEFVQIGFPPLRERSDDIPLLAGYCLCKLHKKHGNVKRITEDGMLYLTKEKWEGNIRELNNCIERAVIKASTKKVTEITAEMLKWGNNAMVDLKTLVEIEKEHIYSILEYTNGNREEAYKILGVSRATLFNKIKEYEL